jgi:hypothetical protein
VGGRGRWRGVGGLIVVGPACRFGLGVGCETAADKVLQGDHGGLLRRRDVEVQVGGAAAEADGDVEGGRCGREEEGGWTAREKRTGVSGRSGRGGCGGGGRRAAGPAGALASGVAHLWPRFSVWECGVGVVVSDDQYGHLSRIQIDIASIPTSCPGCWLFVGWRRGYEGRCTRAAKCARLHDLPSVIGQAKTHSRPWASPTSPHYSHNELCTNVRTQ